jgi:acetyl esterase/lipase
MRRAAGVAVSALFCAGIVLAQMNEHQTILLWPAGAPGAQGDSDADKPSLTLYPATGTNKVATGVVVCPGGGYVHLAIDYEGFEVAEWLNKLGISAFVLKYRLGPKYHYPVQLEDAQRAVRYARLHAQEFGIRPDRIGIWGFSAGGHLASTAGTHFDLGDKSASDEINRESSRPDFMILAYPVVTMMDPYVHRGSLHALLGQTPDPRLVRLLSNELQVTPETPPTFLFHTANDPVVPVENSVEFDEALNKAGVPAEMHIYLKGRHGVGLATDDPVLRTWPERLADWLKAQGLR